MRIAEAGSSTQDPKTTQSHDDHAGIGPDVESSESTPEVCAGDTIGMQVLVKTKAQRLRARIQFVTLCWTLFLAGWNDGTTGPLLPRIQKTYNVNFAVVSLIFAFACTGFLAGALLNVFLNDRYGFGKVIFLGSVFQVIASAIQAAALPFPPFVLGYAINGVGQALQANGFVASLKDDAEAKMGILHAAYGVGALSSPLVATQFVQLSRWSSHYLVSLGIALTNTILLFIVFRLKSQDECLAQIGRSPGERSESEHGHFRQIFASKNVHLLALFIFVYGGVEVNLAGWIVTYVTNVRGGGPSSGYISSGFFGGLTIGRIVLLRLNQKVGEWRVLLIYALLAIGFELVVWFVPSPIADAVSVVIIGVLLGPMYPITMNHAGRVLPPWLLTGAIGWIGGVGQAGSGLLPFMTGVIVSKAGIYALQPLLVAMMVLMMIFWVLVPSKGSKIHDARSMVRVDDTI